MNIASESDWLEAIREGELHQVTCGEIELQDNLDDVVLTDVQFNQTNFRMDRISECKFIDCVFLRTSFSSVQLDDCQFTNCSFYDAEAEAGAIFRFANVKACEFRGCDLSMAVFDRANLYRCEMNDCNLQGAELNRVTIESDIGGRISLHDLTMTQCNLAYSDWTGAEVPEINITGSRLIHSILNEANFEGAQLINCELHGVSAQNVNLRNSDLRGSTLDGLDVREIDLSGTTIEESQQRVLLDALGIVVV